MSWQRFLTGFLTGIRIILFSAKHRRSYEDVSLVLHHLKNNPMRAKEIVNNDNKRGVTNTYHLMFRSSSCTTRPWVARAGRENVLKAQGPHFRSGPVSVTPMPSRTPKPSLF